MLKSNNNTNFRTRRISKTTRSMVRTNMIILLVIVSFFMAWLLNHCLNIYMIFVDPIEWPPTLFSLAPISQVHFLPSIVQIIHGSLSLFSLFYHWKFQKTKISTRKENFLTNFQIFLLAIKKIPWKKIHMKMRIIVFINRSLLHQL